MASNGQWKRVVAKIAAGLWAVAAVCAFPGTANAVPSYARQTGLACEACHTVFPQLTPFGRAFKASGYTLFNTQKVQDINREKQSTLSLSDLPPISMMIVVSTSQAAKAADTESAKSSTDFPQQLSLFYAGHISDNVGAYVQVTYDDQSGTFGMDNTDIRFADIAVVDGYNVIYGLSLNNNPTVQDLWNSTPAWSQPFFTSPSLQSPAAATRIEGSMAQSVAGLSAYVFVDQSIYAEAGVYKTALQGASVSFNGSSNNDVISGVAPYWRLAYENDWGKNSWEFGTFGLAANIANPSTPAMPPPNAPPGNSLQHPLTDRFLDIGLDSQYQFIDDTDQLTVTGRWIHENEHLGASYPLYADRSNDEIDTESLVGSYYWHRKLGATLGVFNLSGTRDATYFNPVTGKPDSTWGNVEIDYLPWLNVKLGLQYTAYFKFDRASSNYDGNGRKASDNNLLYAYLWLAF